MKDLIVAATKKELTPFLEHSGLIKHMDDETLETDKFDLLITGVGLMSTAYSMAENLAGKRYGLIMNFGIAGSFRQEIPIKSIVSVNEEILGDFGAENSDDTFLDIFDMGLLNINTPPYKSGSLFPVKSNNSLLSANLLAAKSISVNRVLSRESSIKWVKDKYDPDIVNMEGAAVFYAAIKHSTPCIQIRAISDFVGIRNRASWDINGAIDVLNDEVIRIYGKRYNLS